MDRRKFIKNSALGAAFVGLGPGLQSLAAGSSTDPVMLIKKFVFIFRGVAYADAFHAFKKFDIQPDLNFHLQKVSCTNHSYTHLEGLKGLMGEKMLGIVETQLQDRHTIPHLLEDVFSSIDSPVWNSSNVASSHVFYLHHSEIGHSSNKLYKESLELFFSELSKYFYKDPYKIIVTADIGRNEKLNSCGGRDHSNPTSLETFALFLGGKASKLAAKNKPLALNQVLKQKF